MVNNSISVRFPRFQLGFNLENRTTSISPFEDTETTIMPPPPPSFFLGYTLPPGHPCSVFSLPPPPADKKRTGPRRKSFLFFSPQQVVDLLFSASIT